MARYEFRSAFAEEIKNYVNDKSAAGFSAKNFRRSLIGFDRFCFKQGITEEPVFTARHASVWIERKGCEAHTTHYSRVNASKHFLTYLSLKGYEVYVVRDVRYAGSDRRKYQ